MATDKRLDQVSQLTDFDYALIVKGDQVAKASKQQLAELVGNLLYGATNASSLASVVAGNLPYVTNKYTSEKDFNNIKSVGSYPFGVALSGFSNIPSVGSLEGLLIVIKATSSNNLIQIYTGIQDNSCHLRTCYNGAWLSWKKIV